MTISDEHPERAGSTGSTAGRTSEAEFLPQIRHDAPLRVEHHPAPSPSPGSPTGPTGPPPGLPMTPTPRPRRQWVLFLPVLLVPALVVVLLIGWVSDQRRRTDALTEANDAYLQGDCSGALAGFAEADRSTIPWSGKANPTFNDAPERYQCGRLSQLADGWAAGDLADVATRYETFRSQNADSPALITLWALVQQATASKQLHTHLSQTDACSALSTLRTTSRTLNAELRASEALKPLVANRVKTAHLPTADLITCARTFEQHDRTADANALYSAAVDLKPGRTLLAGATSGLARTDVQLAREAHAGHLPTPERVSGTGSGPAVVVIQNDSPDALQLTMSGTKPVLDRVGACPGCHNYTGDGPGTCPRTGPQRSFTVPAGVYSVAVRSERGGAVIPFVGSWDLTKGSRYETCFFIVTHKNATKK
jgi:hypothetical protein